MQRKLHPQTLAEALQAPLLSTATTPFSTAPQRGWCLGSGGCVCVCVCCAPESGVEGRDADVSKFPLIPRQSGPRDPTPTQEESSVGDYAGIMPVSPQPLADGATTGHTVQFEKRKSWGHTPSLERKE